MSNMTITSAQYVLNEDGSSKMCVFATIDGQELYVPLDPANRHYAEIKAKHDDPNDSFTIQDAD